MLTKAAEDNRLDMDDEGHPVLRDHNGNVKAGVGHFSGNMMQAASSRRVALYTQGDPRRIRVQETLALRQLDLQPGDVDLVPAMLVGSAANVSFQLLAPSLRLIDLQASTQLFVRAISAGDKEAEADPTSNEPLMEAAKSADFLFRLAYTPAVHLISLTPEYPALRRSTLRIHLRACEDAKKQPFRAMATGLLSMKDAVELRAKEQLLGEQVKDRKTLARMKIADRITTIPAYESGGSHRRVRSTDMLLPGMGE